MALTRLITAGLEAVLENQVSYYRQFSTINKIKIVKLNPKGQTNKTGTNLKIFHFTLRGKLSIITIPKC